MLPNGNVYVADGTMNLAKESKKQCFTCCARTFEALILAGVMAVVIGLFMIPTVYFANTKVEAQVIISAHTLTTPIT